MTLLSESETRELVQTDLPTPGLQRLIDAAEQEIITRLGENYPGPVTHLYERLDLTRMTENWIFLDRRIALVGTSAGLVTALTGLNNDLAFVSLLPGAAGNLITIEYRVAGLNTPLSVSVTGRAITVSVATDGAGAATSSAAQVLAALAGSALASALILGGLAVGNDGSGVVTALSATALAGGVGGIISINEWFGDEIAEIEVELAEDDYRLHYKGGAVERIGSGTNQRWVFGHRVEIVYVPVDDTIRRKEVQSELVRLAVRHTGVQSETVGNESTQSYQDYIGERQSLVESLSSGISFS